MIPKQEGMMAKGGSRQKVYSSLVKESTRSRKEEIGNENKKKNREAGRDKLKSSS